MSKYYIELYQLDADNKFFDIPFNKEVKNNFEKYKIEYVKNNYKKVFCAYTLINIYHYSTINEYLEYLFEYFNVYKEYLFKIFDVHKGNLKYTGRSMCISDIITIKNTDTQEKRWYFVDNVSFVNITEFINNKYNKG